MLIKPFIKWVGGKTQIIDDIINKFPKKINNYYEPFVGGGSVFLELLNKIENGDIIVDGDIIINDKNADLINLYRLIKDNVKKLIMQLEYLTTNYNNAKMIKQEKRHKHIINEESKIEDIIAKGKSYVYYYYRNLYNETKDNFIRSSLLLFLNKTCFRGLYREGKGGFNVPFGNYKNPSIYNKEQLLKLNAIFNKYDIQFVNDDFNNVCKEIQIGDFVYFDPPYYPLSKTSFTSYKNDSFIKQHEVLVTLCKTLNEKNIKFLQSNSDCEYNNNVYKDFTIEKIKCKRRINSKKPQNTCFELFIYN